ncbi:hypothetical protein OF83DRAFT_239858 [Amylostereum chailletii]|nr:hypothetical protein OF83DRAFT_239858 [Amylostereum chailletii]
MLVFCPCKPCKNHDPPLTSAILPKSDAAGNRLAGLSCPEYLPVSRLPGQVIMIAYQVTVVQVNTDYYHPLYFVSGSVAVRIDRRGLARRRGSYMHRMRWMPEMGVLLSLDPHNASTHVISSLARFDEDISVAVTDQARTWTGGRRRGFGGRARSRGGWRRVKRRQGRGFTRNYCVMRSGEYELRRYWGCGSMTLLLMMWMRSAREGGRESREVERAGFALGPACLKGSVRASLTGLGEARMGEYLKMAERVMTRTAPSDLYTCPNRWRRSGACPLPRTERYRPPDVRANPRFVCGHSS